jgi:hypothetical protein
MIRWNNYNKYGNQKTQYKGISFDSKKECNFYIYLEQLEAQGEISELQRQVRFELQPSFKHKGKTIRSITYVADFTFKDKDGTFHIVDVKGSKDTLTETFKIKSKMFLYKYGTEIEIV